ncbi:cell envelope integrity protein CreD [Sphingobium sp. AN641]|uniref:cell envelope integrity protein CreD n=1 Tax=Sphingobium sp. AN641 TaxID=3133443 RepID=UPI0030C53752
MAAKSRTAGGKLLFCILIGLMLSIPLFAVYLLVWERQSQSSAARASIAQGWGGPQVIAGPVLVIPYTRPETETVTENGRQISRMTNVERELFLSPTTNAVDTAIMPERRRKAIYETVLFEARISGRAAFILPTDLARHGVTPDQLHLDRAEIRMGVSDPRGLLSRNMLKVNGRAISLQPGKGLLATGNNGFFAFIDWTAASALTIDYAYAVRGNGQVSLVPRGGRTDWSVTSSWPHPGFGGDFLPTDRDVTDKGFSARYSISNLALGEALVLTEDRRAPMIATEPYGGPAVTSDGGSTAATIGLVELVDPYAQVNRAIKYGFLFVGFTFLAFLMFDIVGGARVASAEYVLAGSGLILFFVLLLAFAEVIGFTWSYLLAAGAITALLTAYSAAVLKSWMRARIIAGLLVGLYATLFVLLNLEAYSLLIGSVLLFVALASVMWATRHIDWAAVGTANDAKATPDGDAGVS